LKFVLRHYTYLGFVQRVSTPTLFGRVQNACTLERNESVAVGEIKWEVRDKLEQANITERVIFPELGVSAIGFAAITLSASHLL